MLRPATTSAFTCLLNNCISFIFLGEFYYWENDLQDLCFNIQKLISIMMENASRDLNHLSTPVSVGTSSSKIGSHPFARRTNESCCWIALLVASIIPKGQVIFDGWRFHMVFQFHSWGDDPTRYALLIPIRGFSWKTLQRETFVSEMQFKEDFSRQYQNIQNWNIVETGVWLCDV